MIIRKATHEQIVAAMHAVNREHDTTLHAGLSAYGNSGIRPVGKGWCITLKLDASTDPFHRHGWRNEGKGKRMTYVCWHGHRAFMRALYSLAPEATIRTGFAYYKGAEHFERTHEDTAWGSSPHARVAYSDMCDCERGECPARKPGRVANISDRQGWTLVPFESAPLPATMSDSGDGDTSSFEKPEGVPALSWSEYNRKFNDLLRGGKA